MPTFQFHTHAVGVAGAGQIRRADPTVMGTASFRASAHCEPFRVAAGHGWRLFVPADFALRWTGDGFQWLHAGLSSWVPAANVSLGRLGRDTGAFEVPHAEAAELPAIVGLPEQGLVQLWTGVTCVSPPGWWTAVRGVPNFAGPTTYDVLEGVIETDWWHGPLLLNLRFRRTGDAVWFRASYPLASLAPVLRETYLTNVDHTVEESSAGEGLLDALAVRDQGRPGGYGREARRRRRQDVTERGASR